MATVNTQALVAGAETIGQDAYTTVKSDLLNFKTILGTTMAAGLTFTAAMAFNEAGKETINYYFAFDEREELLAKWLFAIVVVIVLMIALWLFSISSPPSMQTFMPAPVVGGRFYMAR